MYKILFVCTGNICRSPTAEGVLRKKVEEAGLSGFVEIDSAGTHGYHVGEKPDYRSISIAAERGYSIHEQRSRKFQPKDYNEFDLILALDKKHLKILQPGLFDKPKGEVALFCEYAGLGKQCVTDPYYGDLDLFREVLTLIEEASDKLVEKLKTKVTGR